MKAGERHVYFQFDSCWPLRPGKSGQATQKVATSIGVAVNMLVRRLKNVVTFLEVTINMSESRTKKVVTFLEVTLNKSARRTDKKATNWNFLNAFNLLVRLSTPERESVKPRSG